MKAIRFHLLIFSTVCLLCGCGDEWSCESNGKSLYSKNSSGEIGSADKGCSCDDISEWQLKQYGEIDRAALSRDFGC
ncbi:hypothetical protein [Alteromonas sp. MmMcT2-5]|uniref:hypothetical protein n=1 Tax=Alteromonas sp. MmMcT2-5 TaxID=2917733 RepID=UPI001EF3A606|nr:hypothetical protein [Alteromonas sp. MmMcT2-5]MCG7650988.1 hypothetical protein [Alteromonas sp. MmMcT2-5]